MQGGRSASDDGSLRPCQALLTQTRAHRPVVAALDDAAVVGTGVKPRLGQEPRACCEGRRQAGVFFWGRTVHVSACAWACVRVCVHACLCVLRMGRVAGPRDGRNRVTAAPSCAAARPTLLRPVLVQLRAAPAAPAAEVELQLRLAPGLGLLVGWWVGGLVGWRAGRGQGMSCVARLQPFVPLAPLVGPGAKCLDAATFLVVHYRP